MIDNELDHMFRELEQQLQAQGMTKEMYSQFSGQDEEALKEQMREDAEKRVRSNLTLEAIYNAENLEVTDEDVEKEYEKMAEMYNVDVEKIKQAFGANEDMLKSELIFQKAIDFLVEHSVEKSETTEQTNEAESE